MPLKEGVLLCKNKVSGESDQLKIQVKSSGTIFKDYIYYISGKQTAANGNPNTFTPIGNNLYIVEEQRGPNLFGYYYVQFFEGGVVILLPDMMMKERYLRQTAKKLNVNLEMRSKSDLLLIGSSSDKIAYLRSHDIGILAEVLECQQ